MSTSRFVVAALVGWWFGGEAIAAPQFVQGPGPRSGHAMAYDSARQVVVLFGGHTNGSWPSGALNDTWEWDGSNWTQRSPANAPGPRQNVAMAYDSARGVCVFFGGYDGANLAETWEWDGTDWTPRTNVGSPGARRNHSMVYDSQRQVVVLFGGYNGSFLADTWEYDGNAWVQRAVAGPSARNGMDLAFRAATGEVVLFGGGSGGALHNDTWTWDGVTWTQQSPATVPTARKAHALCYDPSIDRVVLFGGWSGSFPGHNDTWTWDGTDWAQAAPTVRPAARHWVIENMVYDAARGETVLFGGWTGSNTLGDTWTFDGNEWRPKLDYVTSPVNGNRYALSPAMTWQEAEDLAQLEGGHLATVRGLAEQNWLWQTFGTGNLWIGYNDLAVEGQWVWSSGEPTTYTNWLPGEPNNASNEDFAHLRNPNGGWNDAQPTYSYPGIIELPGGPVAEIASTQLATTATPPPVADHAMAPLPGGGALLFGGDTSSGPFFPTYELHGTDWTKQFSFINPMVRSGHTLLLDEARQNVVLFGGANPIGTELGDTWTYAGGQWSYLMPTVAPAPRSEHAMAYDPLSATGILFGGRDAAGTALGDMWAWNGTDWQQVSPPTLPPARFGHGLAWDRLRNRLVLFGGNDGSARLDDVWDWDGTDWAQVAPAQPNGFPWGPQPRDGFVMHYEPRAERVVVIGGDSDSGCLDDVWTWDGTGWTRHSAGNATLPTARAGAAAYVDASNGELRLFGGGCGTWTDELWHIGLPVFSRYESYGQACIGSLGTPTLTVDPATPPVIGTTMTLHYDNVPGNNLISAIGGYGYSRTVFDGLPLPLDLAPAGLPGCFLLNSADEIEAIGTPNGTGHVAWPVALPNDPTLLATEVYFQCLHIEVPGHPTWAAMSNGIAARIGDR